MGVATVDAPSTVAARELVVGGSGDLAVALFAALSASGYHCRRARVDGTPTGAVFVPAADETFAAHIAALAPLDLPVVVVGHLRRAGNLITAVTAGATAVVDTGLPFTTLLAAVLAGLTRRTPTGRHALLAALEQRRREIALVDRLTPREREVLTALGEGLTATDIAGADRVSVATVRSHIRALLRKLGVTSQLSAVALARRVPAQVAPELPEQIRRSGQFW
ncbi:LuxR C-terminal-related transcriptional regulator [Actinosynnema sp. NPDC023587]|uniref:helix-turn-helix transcriptional regulator n=1 Tax=Actinosynnema sp. NPDC023587 TaxID=3154695 RepID=UPI0033F2ED95